MPNYFTRHPSRKENWHQRGTSHYTTFAPRVRVRVPSSKSSSASEVRLPDWSALGGGHGPAVVSGYRLFKGRSRFSTLRFALLLFALATAFSLYIGHVQSTQVVLAELQKAERDNLRLHLKYNRLKGEFDRATGPSRVYERARQIGLEEGIAYGPTIRTE